MAAGLAALAAFVLSDKADCIFGTAVIQGGASLAIG
jgi:hypothetical protein